MLNLHLSAESSHELQAKITALDRFQGILTAHKQDVLYVMPTWADPRQPPPELIGSILDFVCTVCGLSTEEAQSYWVLLRDAIWASTPDLHDDQLSDMYSRFRDLFARPELVLWPPLRDHACLTPGCHSGRTTHLTKTRATDVVVFTAKGTMPAIAVQLTCDQCGVNYRHDYYVTKDQQRHYYNADQRAKGTAQFVQVWEHHFAERDLCESWTLSMLTAWVSAGNIAGQYNGLLPTLERSRPHQHEYKYAWSRFLRADHVWIGFAVHSLLQHHDAMNTTLIVPHDGAQEKRFQAAMEERTRHIREHGQEELMHFCDKCCRTYDNGNGTTKRVWCVVVDGLTLGRTCCSAHIDGAPCTEPLQNSRHHYCATHFSLHDVCRVRGCHNAVRSGCLTCSQPSHAATEETHVQRNTASFRLKEKVARLRQAHAISGMDVELDLSAVDNLDDLDEDQDVTLEISMDGPQRMEARSPDTHRNRPRSSYLPTQQPPTIITPPTRQQSPSDIHDDVHWDQHTSGSHRPDEPTNAQASARYRPTTLLPLSQEPLCSTQLHDSFSTARAQQLHDQEARRVRERKAAEEALAAKSNVSLFIFSSDGEESCCFIVSSPGSCITLSHDILSDAGILPSDGPRLFSYYREGGSMWENARPNHVVTVGTPRSVLLKPIGVKNLYDFDSVFAEAFGYKNTASFTSTTVKDRHAMRDAYQRAGIRPPSSSSSQASSPSLPTLPTLSSFSSLRAMPSSSPHKPVQSLVSPTPPPARPPSPAVPVEDLLDVQAHGDLDAYRNGAAATAAAEYLTGLEDGGSVQDGADLEVEIIPNPTPDERDWPGAFYVFEVAAHIDALEKPRKNRRVNKDLAFNGLHHRSAAWVEQHPAHKFSSSTYSRYLLRWRATPTEVQDRYIRCGTSDDGLWSRFSLDRDVPSYNEARVIAAVRKGL